MKFIFTVKKYAQVEIVEKKSKFIAHIYPIPSKEKAEEILLKIKKEYWDAKHNVYAYRLAGNISKYSDDGEPQGTSGLPVFNILCNNKLENILIIVTRYFGGILLGKGGLMRAYSLAAKLAVEEAGIIEIVEIIKCELEINYTEKDKILYFLEKKGYKKEVIYAETIKIMIDIPKVEYDDFAQSITKLTEGKISIGFLSK